MLWLQCTKLDGRRDELVKRRLSFGHGAHTVHCIREITENDMIYFEIFVYVVKMYFAFTFASMRCDSGSFHFFSVVLSALHAALFIWWMVNFEFRPLFFNSCHSTSNNLFASATGFLSERALFLFSVCTFFCVILGKNYAERYMHRYVEECARFLNGKLWPCSFFFHPRWKCRYSLFFRLSLTLTLRVHKPHNSFAFFSWLFCLLCSGNPMHKFCSTHFDSYNFF